MKRAALAGLFALLLPLVLVSPPAYSAPRSAGFGAGERIVRAYTDGDLSVDDLVRYGVASLTAPESVPADLRPTGPLSMDPERYLVYLSAMSAKASPAAREVLSPAQAQVAPVRLRAGTLAAAANPDCARSQPYRYLNKDYRCWANVDNFVVFYNVTGGVPPTPVESNGRPTAVQNMLDGVAIAATTYRSMGYDITNNASVPHGIFLGVDSLAGRPVDVPFVLPIGYNAMPTVLMPSDPVDYDYWPRHELFHVFQYSYWDTGEVAEDAVWEFVASDRFGSMNWWMESTAEWAAHQTYVKNPSHVPDPDQRDMYARSVGAFLSDPGSALNAWDGLGGSRSYGAFLLPLYLTEQAGANFVRTTWERIRSAGALPIEAIKSALAGRDLNWLLHAFAIANYRLAGQQSLMETMGYKDPDVALWRRNLAAHAGTGADALGGARPARHSETVPVGYNQVRGGVFYPGGTTYLDFKAEKDAAAATLTFKGPGAPAPGAPVPGITWSVLVWARAGEGTADVQEYPQLKGSLPPDGTGTIKVAGFRYPMVATLVATRNDLNAVSSVAMTDDQGAVWTVANYVPIAHRPCTLRKPSISVQELNAAPESTFNAYAAATPNGWTGGDSTYSARMPDGRILWLFSDTFLGPLNADGTRPTSAPLINNSFVIQNGSQLTTVHGGTAAAPKALMPPPDGTHWYWSGDGFIVGNRLQVIFQKYRREGTGAMPFAFDENVVATFSLSNLSTPSSVTKLPSDAGVAWGSAILPAGRSGDGYTYVYGVSDAPTNKQMRIARVKGDDLRQGRWQYYTSWGWTEREQDAENTLTGIANEYSVTPWKGQFLLVSQDSTVAFSGWINAFTSCDPFDGFTNETSVYRMPEPGPYGSYWDGDIISYNAHVHAEQSSDSSLLISYNVNSLDNRIAADADLFRDTSIYRPRFFRAAIS
ncbi:hypothetical protein [Nonomuraea zeae]|uniref:DUF4185 domain-containing protein n=1 Tax=Nonomuraea zeae TaxID=1642303 RepID=A0A5S4G5L4_9ACTN|nr:hypothetical protein [Nonomuraea zeae]TMR28296.1 hypothetical protein ETD85_36385 [Nonomuraea zeae]